MKNHEINPYVCDFRNCKSMFATAAKLAKHTLLLHQNAAESRVNILIKPMNDKLTQPDRKTAKNAMQKFHSFFAENEAGENNSCHCYQFNIDGCFTYIGVNCENINTDYRIKGHLYYANKIFNGEQLTVSELQCANLGLCNAIVAQWKSGKGVTISKIGNVTKWKANAIEALRISVCMGVKGNQNFQLGKFPAELSKNLTEEEMLAVTYEYAKIGEHESEKNGRNIKPGDRWVSNPSEEIGIDAPDELLRNIAENDRKQAVICEVCGDSAARQHYGAIACIPCTSFFQREANKRYTCVGDGTCEITKDKGARCKKCRLQKCFAAGMKKNAWENPFKTLADF